MTSLAPCSAARSRHQLAKALLAGLSILAALPAAATEYSFTLSGTSADRSSVATDINRSGTVVGYSSDNTTGASTAFRFAGGVQSIVAGPAGAVSTDLVGITDSGVMLGNYATGFVDDGAGGLMPGATSIFSLGNGVYSAVSIPGATTPYLQAVSPNGRWLLGNSFDDQGRISSFAFDTLGNSLTWITGSADTVIAAGVNNLGMVVGYDRTRVAGVGTIGTGWTFDLASGQRSDFQVAGSQRSGPRDITDGGVISGYFFTSVRPAVAHSFTGLNGQFQFIDVPGASQTSVLGANDLGALVGQYIDADGNVGAFLAVPVPEPASAALLLAGLVGIGGIVRRQRRAAGAAAG